MSDPGYGYPLRGYPPGVAPPPAPEAAWRVYFGAAVMVLAGVVGVAAQPLRALVESEAGVVVFTVVLAVIQLAIAVGGVFLVPAAARRRVLSMVLLAAAALVSIAEPLVEQGLLVLRLPSPAIEAEFVFAAVVVAVAVIAAWYFLRSLAWRAWAVGIPVVVVVAAVLQLALGGITQAVVRQPRDFTETAALIGIGAALLSLVQLGVYVGVAWLGRALHISSVRRDA